MTPSASSRATRRELPCPIGRVSDLVGEKWTIKILRQAFYGTTKYSDFAVALGVPRPVLSTRLEKLMDAGLLEARQYQEHPPRSEYRLTDKGRAFYDVLAAMWTWGLEWHWDDDDPILALHDRETGAEVRPIVVDEATGERIDIRRLRPAVHARS